MTVAFGELGQLVVFPAVALAWLAGQGIVHLRAAMNPAEARQPSVKCERKFPRITLRSSRIGRVCPEADLYLASIAARA